MTQRVAVAGAGYFARFHLEAWERLPGCDLVGLADHESARRAAWSVPGFETVEALIETTRPDILDIALPPSAHLKTIRLGCAAGVETIICQKPFCGGIEGAREAVALADKAGIRLIVHENFRFQPWYRRAAQWLGEGRLGDVHQMTFRLRPGDGQGPDAYLARQPYFQTMPRFLLHETGVHFFDVFLYLFGPVESVYADLIRRNPAIAGEDAGIVLLRHVSGVQSTFDGNRHLDHGAPDLRLTFGEAWIEGTAAALRLAGDGTLFHRAHGQRDETVLLAPRAWPGFAGDCVYGFQSHVLQALEGAVPLETEASAYLDVLALQDAAYLSAAEGRRVPVDNSPRTFPEAGGS